MFGLSGGPDGAIAAVCGVCVQSEEPSESAVFAITLGIPHSHGRPHVQVGFSMFYTPPGPSPDLCVSSSCVIWI